ncbi:MAG: GNAT family N-acyltransferase [Verrucomicrobiota bacterium]
MILTEANIRIEKRPKYVARLAQDAEDVRRAQRLRFEVFNLELNEGLAESHFNGLDVDPFDAVCDHLIVEHVATGSVVGTYRLQTGTSAAENIGYYSEREFDFSPYESVRDEMIELGRACVHADHRNFNLLHLLWRGIARYAVERNARFLVGCSSLTSQNPDDGIAVYRRLRKKHLVRPELRTTPQPLFHCKIDNNPPETAYNDTSGPSTKLLNAYLAIGAKICGLPAIDREFGTIDFLTLLDLQALPALVRAHFLR